MEKGAIVSGDGEKKLNKYACACAIVGSMISIIFGYGKFIIIYILIN